MYRIINFKNLLGLFLDIIKSYKKECTVLRLFKEVHVVSPTRNTVNAKINLSLEKPLLCVILIL